ncbi:MAG: CPBP family intramembrane glutamic endopeptidase [Wenzhouxiangella sp.]
MPEQPSPPPQLSTANMLGLQFGIVVLAVLLALVFRLDLRAQIEFSIEAVNWAVVGTIPLLLSVWVLADTRWAWAAELQRLMREIVVPLFRTAPAGTVILVSLLAGVGEELLFRGVIQGGLSGLIGPWPALILASVVFGLMHALTRAYFVVATLMGLYLGLFYLWTGNLLIPVLIHFLYDWAVLRYYLAKHSG